MQKPAVTIVVVPRDHFSDTRESLESIFANSDTAFELVYVDGNSPPAIARYIREQSSARGFRLIRSEHYLSPNQARNLGARHVQTRYTIFIDNDVIVAPNWLEPLVRCADETGASITGPLYFAGRPLHTSIHFAGGEAGIAERQVNGRTERHLIDRIFKNAPKERQRTGCAEFHCMLVRTEDFRRIGGLDERMLSTRENIDFCMAIAAAGGSIYIEPRSRVTYLAPVRMSLDEIPFFALRWSDAWDLASFQHLRSKWRLEEDAYFQFQYQNVGWRRRGLMMRAGLLRWLPHWRLQAAAEWCLRPIERRLNRMIAKRHADRHGIDRRMSGVTFSAPQDSPQDNTRPAILFVLPWEPSAAGGVNRVVLSLIEGFEQAGAYRPLLLVNTYPCRRVAWRTPADPPAFYEYCLPAPFDPNRVCRSVLSYFLRLPVSVLRFITLIQRHNVAAVNLHYVGLSAFTVLLARSITFGAFKVVLSFHGADVPHPQSLAQRLLWRFILRRCDAIVACSQSLAEELRTIDSAIAVDVVHNAVDSAACRSKARHSALPTGLPGRRYVVGVGKFVDKKAHDVLIQSFERIAAHHPDLYLAIIGGSGPTFAACQARAAASPFSERILLYRDVPHGSTLAAIAQATLLALPSRREPFGIVILEAGALATPVVASRIGGISEIIQDGYNGVLVSSDDVEALSEALRLVLADPGRSGAQAARLQERVRLNFSLAAQVRAYQHLFDVSRKCAARRPA